MEDVFKPESQTILKLFSNSDSLYQIPDYQRPYSWGDEQVEQLWDDVKTAFENNQDDQGVDINYFLGSVITVPGDKGYQDLIDGQQRITTLMILFCVIRDLFPEINQTVNPDQNPNVIKISKIRRCIYDDNDLRRLKFKTASINQNDFQDVIINTDTKTLKKPTIKNIKLTAKNRFINTASIFAEKLVVFNTANPNLIGHFVDYLFNQVKVIKITCANRSFAIKLFQSLNATGLDLTPTDLLKSYLLSRLNENDSRQFVDDWNNIEMSARDTDFKDLNEVFVSYEYYKLSSNPKKSLNDELEEIFSKEDPNRAINDVKKYLSKYKENVLDSDEPAIMGLRYIRWSLYWKTILAAAFKDEYQDTELLIKELMRFYYLYWIAGKTLTQIKQTSFNILKWIKENRTFDEIKIELRSKITEDKIEDRVRENLVGQIYSEPWCKPLLLVIEYNQTDISNRRFIEMSSDLHVEHIIPVAFNTIKDWQHINDSDFTKFGNSIGNLTLLSGSKNIEASNNPFATKLDIYQGLGKNKNKKMGLTGFEITKKIVIDAQKSGQTSKWAIDDTKKRWNWFCDEFRDIFDFETESLKI